MYSCTITYALILDYWSSLSKHTSCVHGTLLVGQYHLYYVCNSEYSFTSLLELFGLCICITSQLHHTFPTHFARFAKVRIQLCTFTCKLISAPPANQNGLFNFKKTVTLLRVNNFDSPMTERWTKIDSRFQNELRLKNSGGVTKVYE